MQIKFTLDIEPFEVPTRIAVKGGGSSFIPAELPLSELDTATLDILCAEFRKSVMAQAKNKPKREAKPKKTEPSPESEQVG